MKKQTTGKRATPPGSVALTPQGTGGEATPPGSVAHVSGKRGNFSREIRTGSEIHIGPGEIRTGRNSDRVRSPFGLPLPGGVSSKQGNSAGSEIHISYFFQNRQMCVHITKFYCFFNFFL